MLDSSACKRFTAALDNVLDNQEDTDLAAAGERCALARAGRRCFILRCKLHTPRPLSLFVQRKQTTTTFLRSSSSESSS